MFRGVHEKSGVDMPAGVSRLQRAALGIGSLAVPFAMNLIFREGDAQEP
jgi:hypothetical protein